LHELEGSNALWYANRAVLIVAKR